MILPPDRNPITPNRSVESAFSPKLHVAPPETSGCDGVSRDRWAGAGRAPATRRGGTLIAVETWEVPGVRPVSMPVPRSRHGAGPRTGPGPSAPASRFAPSKGTPHGTRYTCKLPSNRPTTPASNAVPGFTIPFNKSHARYRGPQRRLPACLPSPSAGIRALGTRHEARQRYAGARPMLLVRRGPPGAGIPGCSLPSDERRGKSRRMLTWVARKPGSAELRVLELPPPRGYEVSVLDLVSAAVKSGTALPRFEDRCCEKAILRTANRRPA